MGQKVSPIGFRTGVTLDWLSRWYAPSKQAYGECLVEDQKIRSHVDQHLNRQPPYAGVARVEIERTREEVKVVLHTARPGLVIGPRGAEVEKLRGALEDLTGRKVNVEVVEIRNADIDAQLVGEAIAEQLRRRASFRRVIKQRCESAMQAGAKGIKVIVSGRLGGSEMARTETQILGSIPLHTLQANVDYGYAISRTTYGVIGVRVWIYKGMFGEEVVEQEAKAGRFTRRGKR
ncbi:MAG: 30S ribosomal protein S3 [Phycisphaerae bacterium]|nr:30S ribosomal protein S3 [Phycisphaerae bacterium]